MLNRREQEVMNAVYALCHEKGMAVCPACGCDEVKLQPNKLVRRDAIEYLLMLLPAVMGFGLAVIAMFTMLSIDVFAPIGDAFIAAFVGLVAGVILGLYMERRIIKIRRLRKRQKVECYRCNRCSKSFNYIEDL